MTQDRPLTRQVALVTGAARGLGQAIARRLAADGAVVCLCDVDGASLAATAQALKAETGADVSWELVDVADGYEVRSWVDRVQATYGRIDVLVNNAGIVRDGRIEYLPDAAWDQVIDVNLRGVFNACRATFGHMKAAGYGRIVSLSSMSWRGNFGQVNYSAAKAGVVGLTRTLALEGAPHGVTANAVAPGLIDTPMLASMKDSVRDKLTARIPAGHVGAPDDIAHAVAALAAPAAGYITGVVLDVDGGLGVGAALR